jgi:hypothetical protein
MQHRSCARTTTFVTYNYQKCKTQQRRNKINNYNNNINNNIIKKNKKNKHKVLNNNK